MKLIFAAVAISALMSAPAFANADLAKKNACMACHAVDKVVAIAQDQAVLVGQVA